MSATRPSGSFQRVTEYLRKKQQAEPSAPESQPYVIAISRQHGARGSEIAEDIGRQLGWQVYDRNLVDEITGDQALQGTLSETLDERHKSWIVECVEAFTGAASLSDAAYVHRLVRALLSLAARGECVIVGRGAGFRLPPKTTFRVALVAPAKDRVGRIAEEQQISENE
ncbi:MAG: cytidylate kinase-like family protein, partial [Pirellulales bacterium]|nr:cytidylate kinase-like family protein [Pirellulales bacterium]